MTKIHQLVAASAVALLALVVTDARADYAASCAGCHAASGTPEVNFLPNSTGTSGSIRAANNLTYLNTKITAGMGGGTTSILDQPTRQAIVNEIGASPSVAAPVFTNSSAPGGSMTVFYSHTFTASGAPTLVGNAGLSAPFTLASGTLPSGLTLTGSTGVLSGTPTLSGTYTGSIRASNLIGTGPTQAFSITISKLTQATLNAFASPSTVAYLATSALSTTGGSGTGAVTYSSNSGSCTIVGVTLTAQSGTGSCTITATKAADTDYLSTTGTVIVTLTQTSQTISFGAQTSPLTFSQGGSFVISPLATGGASSSPVTYSSTTTGVCTVSGTTVSMVSGGGCTLAADQAADANYSAAPQVTQNVTINAVVPGAPIIGTAVAGNTQATISFTASASNGGSAITSYTATCTPSGTGTNTASPITVTGLTNTTTYTCSVRATNAIGNSAASGTVMVTPMKGSGIAPIIYLLFD